MADKRLMVLDERRTLEGFTYQAGVEYEVDERTFQRMLEAFPNVVNEVKKVASKPASDETGPEPPEAEAGAEEEPVEPADEGGLPVRDLPAATEAAQTGTQTGFDSILDTNDSVREWLAGNPPADTARQVLETEKAGKNRAGALEALEEYLAEG